MAKGIARVSALLLAAPGVLIGVTAPSAAATPARPPVISCTVNSGHATVTPGLTEVAAHQDFQLTGTVDGCAGGSLPAGVLTARMSGEMGCGNSVGRRLFRGTGEIAWEDGTVTSLVLHGDAGQASDIDVHGIVTGGAYFQQELATVLAAPVRWVPSRGACGGTPVTQVNYGPRGPLTLRRINTGDLTGSFTGTEAFDFGSCSFVHQVFDSAYQGSSAVGLVRLHVDGCVSPILDHYDGTFSLATNRGTLTGTAAG